MNEERSGHGVSVKTAGEGKAGTPSSVTACDSPSQSFVPSVTLLLTTGWRSAIPVHSEGALQRFDHVDAFPREQSVARNSAEMTIGGSCLIDWPL